MLDALVGSIFGSLFVLFLILVIYLLLDLSKIRLIKFRPLDDELWQIAFNEKELYEKLNGRLAEVFMPERPILVRFWYKLFPMKFKKIAPAGTGPFGQAKINPSNEIGNHQ